MKQQLLDTITQINDNLSKLQMKLEYQEKEIVFLKEQNEILKKNNNNTLAQIKEYIKELEKIRSHYVDSNNQPR